MQQGNGEDHARLVVALRASLDLAGCECTDADVLRMTEGTLLREVVELKLAWLELVTALRDEITKTLW